MPRFFTAEPVGETVHIRGEDARHIGRVLRMRGGESIILCDLQGTDYFGRIGRIEPEAVEVLIEGSAPSVSEPSVEITLYQAVPKLDKLELIVQKSVELGVRRIVPVLTRRCVSRPDEKSMEKKRERLNKIAYEAAKQSGRGRIPEVAPMLSFEEALSAARADEISLLFYEKGGERVNSLYTGQKQMSIWIGSEGGFDQQEVDEAAQSGVRIASLGTRILRCETAPLCALSVVLSAAGDI